MQVRYGIPTFQPSRRKRIYLVTQFKGYIRKPKFKITGSQPIEAEDSNEKNGMECRLYKIQSVTRNDPRKNN